jgi:glycine cleavage system H protein
MTPPADRKYTKDHEWIQHAGSEGTVGITHFAQEQLGDVVFVELPEVGRRVSQGDMFGTIESVKAVSELYSPMSGEVVGVNTELAAHPEQVNKAPYDAWMIRLRLSNPGEDTGLLSPEQYAGLLA